MHERGRRSTDREAPLNRRKDDVDQTTSGLETGQSVFPLFAETPFLAWHHRHHKYRLSRQLHPSVTPVILLWDESNEVLPSEGKS